MDKPIWMPFYVDNYLGDTQHLTTLQHGAYLLMLMTAWKHGGELPDDEKQLKLITKIDPKLWLKNKPVLMQFFEQKNGVLVQKRLASEYEKSKTIQDRAKTNGAKGGRPKKTPKNNPEVIPGLTQNAFLVNPGKSQSQSQVLNTSTKDVLSTLSGTHVPEVNGNAVDLKVPACPQQEIIGLYHEHLPLCPKVREWNNARQGYLKSRWREKAMERHWTSKQEGLAMFAKLFDFIGESKFLTGKVQAQRDKPPFVVTLEWILRPNNWAKIIEGKYHNDQAV